MSSTVLRRAVIARQFFAPTDPTHVKSLEHFLKTGSWGDIQFHHEAPFVDVPMTVLRKFTEHALSIRPADAVVFNLFNR